VEAGLWAYPFDASVIRDIVEDLGFVLPTRPSVLAFVIANDARLWPHFCRAYQGQAEIRNSNDPLDRWLEQTLERIVLGLHENCQILWSHRTIHGCWMPMTRIAVAAGFAAMAPCHLAVRTDVGPWLAIRAIVVADTQACESPPINMIEPCSTCEAPCMRPFEEASRRSDNTQGTDRVLSHWKSWLCVRDSCPFGRAARYSESQILYHYTRDRRVLEIIP
jgi:methylmalonic aciduria homocystinuria type C protein